MSACLSSTHDAPPTNKTLTAQRDALLGLGVEANRVYADPGLTGTNRERPGLREALAACRAGNTLVVTKLDNSTASPGPCPTPAGSPTSSPIDRSA